MTRDQIALLLILKASKERGAASLGCSSRLDTALQLEKMGLIRQHGFGPTAFYITPAGLAEAAKHKAPPPAPKAPAPAPQAAPAPARRAGTGRGKNTAQTAQIVDLMRQPKGVTRDEVLKILGWQAISMQDFAARAGVKLVIDKAIKPFRYRAE